LGMPTQFSWVGPLKCWGKYINLQTQKISYEIK
jgi:hypothetical protein